MAQNDTEADDARTSIIDIRYSHFREFEKGESVRVHYATDPAEPSETIAGTIEARYNGHKVMLVTADGRKLIADLSDTASEGGLRDFDTGEVLGRPMFTETAYHPDKDGHALREELLG